MRWMIAGLGLYYAKYYAHFVAIILACLAALQAVPLFSSHLLSLPAYILGIIGCVLCLRGTPRDWGRGLLVGALVCDTVALGVGVIALWFPSLFLLLFLAVTLLSVAAWALFMVFLMRLGDELGGRDRAFKDEALQLIVYGSLLYLSAGGIVSLARYLYRDPVLGDSAAVGLLVYFLSLVWVVFYAKYLIRTLSLISGLREAIRSRMP